MYFCLVQDLAARFADGRLSTEKLLKADDEELAQLLIEVRGIGRVRVKRYWLNWNTKPYFDSGLVIVLV